MEDGDNGRAHGPDDTIGEPLPLPRRDGQTHIEPQLREPGGTGSGTPFAAFDPTGDPPTGSPDDAAGAGARGDGATPAGADGTGPGWAGERVAAFRAAVRRATRGDRR